MTSMARAVLLMVSVACWLLAGCGDFFTKENNGGGGSTSAHFAYVVNTNNVGAGSISVFKVDATSGALSATANVSTPTLGPQGATIAAGKFLYVGSNGGGVAGYVINASTGGLTDIAGSPFGIGNVPLSVSATPSGKFLYVADALSSTIFEFAIDSASGALTALSTPGELVNGSPQDIKVDVSGRFLFVALANGGLSVFKIDANTGLLSARQDFATLTGGQPTWIALETTARYLYLVDQLPGVEPFGINLDGTVTAKTLPSSPSGTGPVQAAADRTGSFLYVANSGSNNISGYVILGSGVLQAISGEPFNANSGPQALACEPSGKFLYVAHVSGAINIYSLDANSGKLTLTLNATAGADPRTIVFL